ncbi:MAG: hypothetical protein AAGI68_00305 [Planctomycetota bacterium]
MPECVLLRHPVEDGLSRAPFLCVLAVALVLSALVVGSASASSAPSGVLAIPGYSGWVEWSPKPRGNVSPFRAVNDRLLIERAPKSFRAYRTPEPLAGHLDIRMPLPAFNGQAAGLVLIVETEGEPDGGSYIRLERTLVDGQLVVRMRGRWQGQKLEIPPLNLQDSKLEGDPDRLGLDLAEGVIRLRNDTPELRVIRNQAGGALHLQFADRREIDGRWVTGWTELPTLPLSADTAFYLGVYGQRVKGVKAEPMSFELPRVVAMPAADRDDSQTGFAAKARPYTWAGYTGDAVVVTFDERASHSDTKFVFWSEANYVPWWHLDDRSAVSYEFVEIWGGDTVGCNEPMSDHLLRYSTARVVESNAAQVVVEWDYVLIDSAYRWWNNHPTIRPTVKEVFTFYPDGTGVRKVVYSPPLEDHETFHKWGHELAELMVATGGGVRTHDYLRQRALSVFGLEDDEREDYTWDLAGYDNVDQWRHNSDAWSAVITRANMREPWPSPYIAFPQEARWDALLNPTAPLKFGSDWELRSRSKSPELLSPEGLLDFGGFSHWPVMKQPYDNREWIGAEYLREPKHVALISVTTGQAGEVWPVGPKQRTYAMLVGLTGADDDAAARAEVKSWLAEVAIKPASPGVSYVGPAPYERGLRLAAGRAVREVAFEISASEPLINPVFLIDGWAPGSVCVSIDGERLAAHAFRHAVAGGGSVVWLERRLDRPSHIKVELLDDPKE